MNTFADATRILQSMANGPSGSVRSQLGFLCAVCGGDVHAEDPCFLDTEKGDVCVECGEELS